MQPTDSRICGTGSARLLNSILFSPHGISLHLLNLLPYWFIDVWTTFASYWQSQKPAITSLYLSLQYYPDKAVRREILQLQVLCTHYKYGCPWIGQLQHFDVRANRIRHYNYHCWCRTSSFFGQFRTTVRTVGINLWGVPTQDAMSWCQLTN